MRLAFVAAFSVLLGCGKRSAADWRVSKSDDPLTEARTRSVPVALFGKLSIKVRTEENGVQGPTGAVLVTSRPGKGHLAVLGPFGGPLLKTQTNGVVASVTIMRDQRHLVTDDVDALLEHVSGGLGGIDSVLALLVGDLPLDEAPVMAQSSGTSGEVVVLEHPSGGEVRAVIDPRIGTLTWVEIADANGTPLLTAQYEPYAYVEALASWLPTKVEMVVPGMGLGLDARFKSWSHPEFDVDVFSSIPPEGFTVETIHLEPDAHR